MLLLNKGKIRSKMFSKPEISAIHLFLHNIKEAIVLKSALKGTLKGTLPASSPKKKCS